jgi:hypothetical protein
VPSRATVLPTRLPLSQIKELLRLAESLAGSQSASPLNVLGRFSVRDQKHHKKYVCKKSTRSKFFSKKNDKHLDVSFPSIFFWFYRVLGCFAAIGIQNTTKNVSQKNRVEKFLQNKSTDNPKPIFCRFLSRFWAFLGEGSSKALSKKYPQKNLTLILFWPLTHPPTTGSPTFFLPAPCSCWWCLVCIVRAYQLPATRF